MVYSVDKNYGYNKLYDLFNLRKKADYDPFYNISEGELDDAMYLMEQIFKTLKI